jgi:hypothetical protein
MERRREEAEAGADRKSRLVEESELPEFLNQVHTLMGVLNSSTLPSKGLTCPRDDIFSNRKD